MQVGLQFVVLLLNVCYVLNVVNVCWGSLYDVLYGIDVLFEDGGVECMLVYNLMCGQCVIDYVCNVFDIVVLFVSGLYCDVLCYCVQDGQFVVEIVQGNVVFVQFVQFVGYQGVVDVLFVILLKYNGLYFEIQIDVLMLIGCVDFVNVKDVVFEVVVSMIIDCEDLVVVVDVDDKVQFYCNWFGLMQGMLVEEVVKGGKIFMCCLNVDCEYMMFVGGMLLLYGCLLLFVCNVGYLMINGVVFDCDGNEILEGIFDGVVMVLCVLYDLKVKCNLCMGLIYIVKLKMYGLVEVVFVDMLFVCVEDLYGLLCNMLKMGIMDEECCISVNFVVCIVVVVVCVVFINIGFFDCIGDEMYIVMEVGLMICKGDMKLLVWIQLYECNNVFVGLLVGLCGCVQIGKGMWVMLDLMYVMFEQKIVYLCVGVNIVWVLLLIVVMLYVLYYYFVDVQVVQQEFEKMLYVSECDVLFEGLLIVLVVECVVWSEVEILSEVENNVQGIFGYVVCWVEQGVGCLKVLDIYDVGLMEDCVMLCILSQYIVNWLCYGVIIEVFVFDVFKWMVCVVDQQNVGDLNYCLMVFGYDQLIVFQVVCVFVL